MPVDVLFIMFIFASIGISMFLVDENMIERVGCFLLGVVFACIPVWIFAASYRVEYLDKEAVVRVTSERKPYIFDSQQNVIWVSDVTGKNYDEGDVIEYKEQRPYSCGLYFGNRNVIK